MAGNPLNKLIFFAVVVLHLNVPSFASHDFTEPSGARWPKGVIRVSLSTSFRDVGSISGREASEALIRALNKWESVSDIRFEIEWSDKQLVSLTGNTGDGESLITIASLPENILLFSNERMNAAAVTRVFRNKQNQITEADIVLNPYRQFSVDGSIATYDLEQVFTHEIGHMIGLEHSVVVTSVMFEDVKENGLFGQRNSGELARVDISNAVALYGSREVGLADCKSMVGRLLNKNAPGLVVAAHDVKDGKLISAVEAGTNGTFSMPCLPVGKYQLMVTARPNGEISISDRLIQVVSLNLVPIVVPPRKVELKNVDFDLVAIGRDGRIDGGPVVFGRGETLNVLITGHNIAQKRLKLSSSSPLISIRGLAVVSSEFNTENDVIRAEIRTQHSISPGEYSLVAEDEQGSRKLILGAFRVK